VIGLGGGLDVIHALDLERHELSVAARPEGGLPTGYYGMCLVWPPTSPLYPADVGGWDLYALELEMP
jgi:hypothetical protein